ncbi:nucleolar complex protein 3 homolog [Ctenocephalides felis]|uniref:nucleolar complex protein 3 homolog n=1 Tax=Ctenocephalides felis TaxID=7515 RepID=UPI000E6E365B|nr:nucleolar complex protein 3 homolog [Ctenocephalides felis]
MAVKKQNKISKVKRNNQKKNKLTKQGKIKNKRNKVALKTNNQVPPPKNDVVYSDSEESDHGQGMLEMVEKDDLSFLQKAVAEKSTSYSLLNKIRFKDKCEPIKQRKRKPNLDGEDNEIESRYEEENVDEKNSKRTKLLLPIKTKSGLIMRSVDEEIPDDEDEEVKENIDHNMQTRKDDDDSDDDDIFVLEDDNEIDPTKPVSVAELFAKRQAELQKQKFRIGVFCSGLLESPEKNSCNNHLLKAQSHDVYTDALACLLALRIQDVNLDAKKKKKKKKYAKRIYD